MDDELLAQAKAHLYPNYRQPPMVIAHGSGAELWDGRGKRYLDLFAGIAVSAVGHGHPRLTRAVAEQAASLLHVSNYFYNEPNVRLAARLAAATGMDRVLFCNSGTEAVEAVLKLARRHYFAQGQPERYHVIAFEGSFHGRTLGALTATGQPGYREGFGPLAGVIHVPYGDADAVATALNDRVAAVLVEPVQGEGGVVPAPAGFLARLRELCDAAGALLLSDEVQTGVGRTGCFLGIQHYGVVPDAITMAKGLGGGVPIGAMACREHLANSLPPGSHGSTFGGNPLASAAALAVLDVLASEGLMAHARDLGAWLGDRLAELATRHDRWTAGARGLGLLRGLVLRPEVDARAILTELRERGVLMTLAGGRVLRISPPLVVSKHQLEEALEVLDDVLRGLDQGAREAV